MVRYPNDELIRMWEADKGNKPTDDISDLHKWAAARIAELEAAKIARENLYSTDEIRAMAIALNERSHGRNTSDISKAGDILDWVCYRIAELEAEIAERRMDYGEDCKRLDARIAELERLTAMSVESLAYIRGIAEKGGEEEVPDSAPTHQAILGYVMFLEAQLAAAQEWERWIPISDGLPENIRPVLVRAQDKRGECFVLRAAYAHKRELEIDSDDYADGFADHDEDNGIDYCPEGWYEWNYTDEVHYYLGHLEITHWRELPAPPAEKE